MSGLFVKLEVDWVDDEDVIAVDLEGAGLHAITLCLAKRSERDGWVHRRLLHRYGATDELLERLVTATLLEQDGERFRPSGWLRRNPSQAAIDASRASKSENGRRGNHKKHRHPGDYEACPICHPTEDQPRSSQGAIANPRTAIAPDRTPSPESESESESSPPHLRDDPPPERSSDEDERPEGDDHQPPVEHDDPPDTRATDAIELIARDAHRRQLDRGLVVAPGPHLAACIDRARHDHHTTAALHARTHPDWDPQRIAQAITDPTGGTVPAHESRHPVVFAALTRPRPDDEPPADHDTAHRIAQDARRRLQEARRPSQHPGDAA